jgi:hypothetical protein
LVLVSIPAIVVYKMVLGKKDEIGYIVKKSWFYRLFVLVHRIAGNYIIHSLLVFSMPRYNYEFYSLVTRKIANFLIPERVAIEAHPAN